VIGNGKKFARFWDRVQKVFNKLCLIGCTLRFARLLEAKWGIIKHDVAKFIGNYIVVLMLCESRIAFEDTFHKALDLYKTKHPKHQAFTYLHVWYVLKDIPQSQVDMQEEVKKTSLPMKIKTNLGDYNNINSDGVQVFDAKGITFDVLPTSKQPPSCKRAKEDQKA
jgi:hypothetical protein